MSTTLTKASTNMAYSNIESLLGDKAEYSIRI